MMAQELSESQISSNGATSIPNWWDVHIHAIPSSPWSHNTNTWLPQNLNSVSACEDYIAVSASSFADHSTLSADSAAVQFPGEHAEHNLWRQLLFGVGSLPEDGRENIIEMISTKNQINDPAFNYLKKLEGNNWGAIQNSNPLNYTGKHPVAISGLSNLSDLATNWSIAPPVYQQRAKTSSPETCLMQANHQLVSSSSYSGVNAESPWSSIKNFSFGKPLIDFRGQKSCTKSSDSVDSKNQATQSASVSSEGKKKRSEDNVESRLKKSKSESSTAVSNKVQSQAPKVKLADRITALQQIVSPFGKTDTASVLLETINFITYLHEQVQLLSDPYMKPGFPKDPNSWGGVERKNETDLKSRGLCLVPVSCTPSVYRENNGPDFWTPTYRGCLYR